MVSVIFSGKLPTSISRSFVEKLVNASCHEVQWKKQGMVSVVIVGDKKMLQLNHEYRGKERVTDILSFGVDHRKNSMMISQEKADIQLGDLVLCLPQIHRQAKQIGRTLRAEFSLMIVHGTLHLLGFDHETVKDEEYMFCLQQDILMKMGIL